MVRSVVAFIVVALALLVRPAFAAPPLEAYGKLPGLELAALSPSGKQYAVIGVVGEERRVIVVDDAGKPVLTAAVGDFKVRGLSWGGEDHVIVTTSNTTVLGPYFNVMMTEIAQVLVVNVKTQKAFWVLNGSGPADNGVFGQYGVRQIDGRWYGFFGGVTLARTKEHGQYFFESGHPDLYRVDLDSGDETLVARRPAGDNSYRDWTVGADGAVLATFDLDRRTGAWKIRAEKRGVEIVSGSDPYGYVDLLGAGRSEGSVLYSRRRGDGTDEWREAPLSGGAGDEVFADEAINHLIRQPGTGLLLGYERDGDEPQAVLLDPTRQGWMDATRKAFPDVNVSLKSWSEDFTKLIVFTAGIGDPGTWWLVDIGTGNATEIGWAYPAVRSADVGPMKIVSYKAADGLKIDGVITLPPGREAKNLPLVVLPHGGPTLRDYPTFDWFAQAFASRGYAVFQPNFRGSSGYSAEFRDAGDGEWGGKMQTDISDGVADLARQGIVDPKRACIVGFSYGGYAALAGVTVQNGLYRCAVSVAGVSDLQEMFRYIEDAAGAVSPSVRNWKRDVGEYRDLVAISPAKLATRADAPVLLIHGKDDVVVPFNQSRIMERALKSANKPVEFVSLKGEDHHMSRGDTRLMTLQAAVAFVEKHNPPNKN